MYDALKNNEVDTHKDILLSGKVVYKAMYGMIPLL